MRIGIIRNRGKKKSAYYVEQLTEEIHRACRRCASAAEQWIVLDDGHFTDAEIVEQADILVSVGGDGTFLKVAAKALARDIPVFGFNLGTLGLLTEFDQNDLEGTVERLIQGDYTVEDRRVLHVKIINAAGETVFSEYALNDCVAARSVLSKVAYLNLYINDCIVDTYPCDGLIVATQTGSTAYALSAGGPIVEPGNDVMIVTPICSHYTDGRAIVAKGSSDIGIRMCIEHPEVYVTVDGHLNYLLQKEDRIICSLSDKTVKIIRIDPPNFYEALRRKAAERRERVQHEI